MTIEKRIKHDITHDIVNIKKDKLISKLSNLLLNKLDKLIEVDISLLKVIAFELDCVFDFEYICYAEPNIIPQNYWKNTLEISISKSSDSTKLEKIIDKYKKEYNYDSYNRLDFYTKVSNIEYKLKDTDVAEFHAIIEELDELLFEIESEFFSECWKIAKSNSNSNLRAFLYIHESSQYDLDNKVCIDSDNIINTLNDEGFEFIILPEIYTDEEDDDNE